MKHMRGFKQRTSILVLYANIIFILMLCLINNFCWWFSLYWTIGQTTLSIGFQIGPFGRHCIIIGDYIYWANINAKTTHFLMHSVTESAVLLHFKIIGHFYNWDAVKMSLLFWWINTTVIFSFHTSRLIFAA